jgi:hypothetical protein
VITINVRHVLIKVSGKFITKLDYNIWQTHKNVILHKYIQILRIQPGNGSSITFSFSEKEVKEENSEEEDSEKDSEEEEEERGWDSYEQKLFF